MENILYEMAKEAANKQVKNEAEAFKKAMINLKRKNDILEEKVDDENDKNSEKTVKNANFAG